MNGRECQGVGVQSLRCEPPYLRHFMDFLPFFTDLGSVQKRNFCYDICKGKERIRLHAWMVSLYGACGDPYDAIWRLEK